MVRFTIRQCVYFLAVARHGGVAQAARALGISQPAVTQAIDKLEESIGLRLFVRHHARGMELTLQGRAFLDQAQTLAGCVERMDDAIADIAANRRGTIRLGLYGDLTSGLLSGDLDLAILYNLGLDPHEVSWHDLSQARPYVILPARHPLARRRRVSLRDLGGDAYVLFDAPGSREYFHAMLAKHGVSPKISFRSTSLESVRSAVGHGLGFSILSMRPHGEESYEGHPVVPVEIADSIAPTPIVIAHKAGRAPNALLADFMAFCKPVFRGKGNP